MGRKAGSMYRYTCRACGTVELASGSNANFKCSDCRPPRSPKQLAAYAVKRAIKAGDLPRPDSFACVDCGELAIEYEHRDYSKPLDVEPICRGCNLKRGPAIPPPGAIAALIQRGKAPYVTRGRTLKLLARLGVPQEVGAALPSKLTVADWRGLLPHLPKAA